MTEPLSRDRRAAFADAAHDLLATVRSVGDRWAEPGLGVWDIRALVGHASRACTTIREYLDAPPPGDGPLIASPGEYFAQIGGASQHVHDAVAARGVEAGAALGDDPAQALTALVERTLAMVAEESDDRRLAVFGGAMRLTDYLDTRTFELVTHTQDLRRALGTTGEPPPGAAAVALAVLAEVAIRRGHVADVIASVTGRPLAAPFSLL
jgi:uncharacterized protein (TIGR03083 family)